MNEATRRQILADLGIEVWLPRAELLRERRQPPAAARVAAERSRNSESARHAADDLPPQPARPAMPPSPQPQAAEPPAATAKAPFSVLSLAGSGVVLLIGGNPSRRALKLARDLLAAATGAWHVSPRRREFRWPSAVPGAARDAGAAERALAAFVDKDIADHQVTLLLCTADVDARLGDLRAECRRVVIPALDALGGDAAAKRALWQLLCEAAG